MKTMRVFVLLVFWIQHVTCNDNNTTYANLPQSSSVNVSISANCSGADCATNSTRYDHVPGGQEEDKSMDPPFWCPKGYNLYSRDGSWYHLCRLQPCVTLDIGDANVTSDSFRNSTAVSINQTSSTATLCARSFSGDFEACPKRLLEEGQYEIASGDGSLWDLVANSSVLLGEYSIRGNGAIVCDDSAGTVTEHHKRIEQPLWCMPLDVPHGLFRNETDNLYVDNIQVSVPQIYFKVLEDSSAARVCVAMDPGFVSCRRNVAALEGHMFSVLPNMEVQVHDNVLKAQSFPLGRYLLAQDKSQVFYCPDVKAPITEETLYIYGSVALLSAFCLLLALVAHMFFPTLNYHTKALMCLAFSLFVAYIAIAIRNFSGTVQAGPGNVVLFAVQYISALGAFFWLNVLAFDLWQVFSKLQGRVGTGDNKARRRVFLAKCTYAWGIPTLLCAIVIGVSYSPETKQALYVDFNFEEISWFHEVTGCLIFFYTPVIIVLIENLVFFILTILNIKKASSGTDILNKKVSRKLFKVYIKLFLVMGIFWIAEVVSWFMADLTQEYAWYFTDIINSLQGVFIFLVYVCKKKTLRIIKSKLGYINMSDSTPTTSRDTSNPTTKATRTTSMPLETIKKQASL